MVDMSTPTVHSAMLCVSAYEGDLAEARRFLSAGTPVDALAGDGHVRGYTALTATCGFSESTEMVDLLLEHGACIDKVNHYGRSPLMCAVINGSSKMSQHLSERGAALDLRHKNGMCVRSETKSADLRIRACVRAPSYTRARRVVFAFSSRCAGRRSTMRVRRSQRAVASTSALTPQRSRPRSFVRGHAVGCACSHATLASSC
jgi:hypothetical protein